MISRWLVAIPGVLAAALIGCITLLLMAAVIGRYSGLYTLVWAEEAARAMFIWLALLGAAVAIQREGHFRLDIIEKLLWRRPRIAARAVAHGAMGLLGAALIVTGSEMVQNSAGQYTNALAIPLSAIYLAVPVGGTLFVLFSLARIARLLLHPTDPQDGDGSEMDAGTTSSHGGAGG